MYMTENSYYLIYLLPCRIAESCLNTKKCSHNHGSLICCSLIAGQIKFFFSLSQSYDQWHKISFSFLIQIVPYSHELVNLLEKKNNEVMRIRNREYRFASLHYIASLFLIMKMPCISQSECHVAPPQQPLPNSYLLMNLLHSTEPDI